MSLFCSLVLDPEDVNNYGGDRGGALGAQTKLVLSKADGVCLQSCFFFVFFYPDVCALF